MMKVVKLINGARYTGVVYHGTDFDEVSSYNCYVCGFRGVREAMEYARPMGRSCVVYLFEASEFNGALKCVRIVKSDSTEMVSHVKKVEFDARVVKCDNGLVAIISPDWADAPYDSYCEPCVYVVREDRVNADSDERVFEGFEEANQWAEMVWDHLTKGERGRSHVYVELRRIGALEDYAFDEDGFIDWSAFESDPEPCPGGFDSELEKRR